MTDLELDERIGTWEFEYIKDEKRVLKDKKWTPSVNPDD